MSMKRYLFGLLAGMSLLAGCSSTSYDVLQSAANHPPKFQDQKPHHFDGNVPHGFPVHGTDVSKWNGAIDWAQVRKSGIEFAFIKSTEGTDRVDSGFETNWRGAKAQGIAVAPYHFYYWCASAEAQARWFIQNVPKAAVQMPPVFDAEWNDASPTCKTRPPRSVVLSEMAHFLKRIEAHYGKRPIIYTSVDFHADNLVGQFNEYPFWLRSTAAHPSKPYPGRKWLFWQYTGTGNIPGIKGISDINVFAGTRQSYAKWLSDNR
jgi:lysozyme